MQEVKYISLLFSTLNLSTIETVRDSVAGVTGVTGVAGVTGVRQCSRREQCEYIPSIKNKNYTHVYLAHTAHPITTAQVSTWPRQ